MTIIIFCCTSIWLLPYFLWGRLEIIFLDIGQGDSFLIKTPDHYQLLVDAGRDERARKKLQSILAPWERLDAVLLSHPDGDHVGDMAGIVRDYRVSKSFYNEINHDNEKYLELQQEAGTNRVGLVSGDVWRIGCCVIIEVLWPTQAELSKPDQETNHLSTAILLRYGQFSLFAAGDLDEKVEASLAGHLTGLKLTALKVSHHGSNTSTPATLLEPLRPEFAVIQVGENTYGHPTAQTLKKLSNASVKVLRNDQNGDISLSTDGGNYFTSTEK